MEAIPYWDNRVGGYVAEVEYGTDTTIITVENDESGDSVKVEDRFLPGMCMDVYELICYSVEANTAEEDEDGIFTVTLSGIPEPELYNVEVFDDDFDLSTCPPSSRNLLSDSESFYPDISVAQAAYPKAYIAVDDEGGVWNSTKPPKPYSREPKDEDRGNHQLGNDRYWIGYVINAYQFTQDKSSDPDAPAPVGSTAIDDDLGGSEVLVETNRDRNTALGISTQIADIVAHEITHLFSEIRWEATTVRNIQAVDPQNPLRRFTLAGDIPPEEGLIIKQCSWVWILHPYTNAVLDTGKLQTLEHVGNTCIITLIDDLSYQPQVGDKCQVFSQSIMGQPEGGEGFCPKTLKALRQNTAGPLP